MSELLFGGEDGFVATLKPGVKVDKVLLYDIRGKDFTFF